MDLIMGEVQGCLLKLMFHLLCRKIRRKDWKIWQDYVVLLCSARSILLTEVCALLIRTLIFQIFPMRVLQHWLQQLPCYGC